MMEVEIIHIFEKKKVFSFENYELQWIWRIIKCNPFDMHKSLGLYVTFEGERGRKIE